MATKHSTQPGMKHHSYPPSKCTNIQKITGSVLYYARAVATTVLMPLNDIATDQTKATEKIQAAANQLLDYLATHSEATIRYHKLHIILHIHSDAYYLSTSHARIRLGGLFYCGSKPPTSLKTQRIYPQCSCCHKKCSCNSSIIISRGML
jgi:hypothetical protein